MLQWYYYITRHNIEVLETVFFHQKQIITIRNSSHLTVEFLMPTCHLNTEDSGKCYIGNVSVLAIIPSVCIFLIMIVHPSQYFSRKKLLVWNILLRKLQMVDSTGKRLLSMYHIFPYEEQKFTLPERIATTILLCVHKKSSLQLQDYMIYFCEIIISLYNFLTTKYAITNSWDWDIQKLEIYCTRGDTDCKKFVNWVILWTQERFAFYRCWHLHFTLHASVAFLNTQPPC